MPRRTVLCVDDNQALVDNLREILEDRGYRVLPASSCAHAVELARGGFGVALVDVRLPDGEGTALAGRLREISPDGQIILLTGFASLESAAAAVRAGAWAYLVKPCATPDLLLAIDQAFQQVNLLHDKRELTRRTQVAEKLAAIGTLTAGLSHEIKNPLNAATLQLRVLESRLRRLPPDAQPPLRQPLQLVQDEILRLNQLLEEFLAFARPREIVSAPVNLATLLEQVVDLLSVEGERGSVRIERAWGAVVTRGDERRLHQAIVNLVKNAIQAAPPGGFVRITTHSEHDEIELVIEDSGPGIPEALRRRVFEPFFTTKAAGSGLGLPLVHSIVEQHGGSITLESGEAGGARFLIRLPGATSPQAHAP